MNDTAIPTRFQLRWLAGPLAIIIVAGVLAFFFSNSPDPFIPLVEQVEQPILVEERIDVNAAKLEAVAQCSLTFDCSKIDCLEKVLTHIDSSTVSIQAILRTPAPKVLRDHLRSAIKRGVNVQMVLDASLNPKFYLQGATIRVKSVSKFVAANFMIIDNAIVVHGSNPQVYASSPDIIHVACEDAQRKPYLTLFDRVWESESAPFSSETTQEEAVGDSDLSISEDGSGGTCDASECGPDTFTCEGTTKVFQNYFCDSSCVYEIILLYYSPDCGYGNPGFDEDGNSLITITETEVDEGQIANEFLEFTSTQAVELTGFTLVKDDTPLVTFTSTFILNGAARVYTSTGETTDLVVYLNQLFPLWNESGTTATLLNPNGLVVATRTFE